MYILLLRISGMKFTGVPRYIDKDVETDGIDNITLGNRVVISNKCFFLTHDYSVTTGMILNGNIPDSYVQIIRPITIGNNVFIGKRSIILPGVSVGNNVIVGAGTILRGNIPDNSIFIGNPCSVVGTVTDLARKWKRNSDLLQYD